MEQMQLKYALAMITGNIAYLQAHPDRKIEEQTKTSLIFPLLKGLGYDIFSPAQVVMEGQSVSNPKEHIDFVIKSECGEKFYIEAKKLDAPLADTHIQLNRYFQRDASTKIAIVTDGRKYHFYTDTLNKNILDTTPYYSFCMDDLSGDDVKFLSSFANGAFSSDRQQIFALQQRIHTFATSIKRDDLMVCSFSDIASELHVEMSYLIEYGINRAASVLSCYEDPKSYLASAIAGIFSANASGAKECDLASMRESSDVDAETGAISMEDLGSEKTPKSSTGADGSPQSSRDMKNVPEDVVFFFTTRNGGFSGKMRRNGDTFTILAGSELHEVRDYTSNQTVSARVASLRTNAKNKISKDPEGRLVLVEDVEGITSPSTAGGFISGGSTNGWTSWKDETGKTLEDYALGK